MAFNLANLHVLVTRPEPQGRELAEAIRHVGGVAVYFPTLEIVPAADQEALQKSLQHLDQFDWLIFVSPQAVWQVAEKIKQFWPQFPERTQIAAVGAGTAKAIAEAKLPPAIFPSKEWNSEGLLALPELQAVKDKAIAIICAPEGRDTLVQALTHKGARVEKVLAYQRTCPSCEPTQAFFNVIISTSNESLKNLKKIMGEKVLNISLLVISQRMERYAKSLGFQNIFLAKNMSQHAILETLSIIKEGVMTEEKVSPSISRRKWGKIIGAVLLLALLVGGIYCASLYLITMHKNTMTQVSQLQKENVSLQDAQMTLQNRVSQTTEELQAQLHALQQAQGSNKTLWTMLEVKYLINLANDQVQFEHNPVTAVVLLQKADQRLRDLRDSGVSELRQALANDISTLQAIPSVDVVGIYSRLSALSRQINQLSLPTKVAPVEASSTSMENVPWWRKGLRESWAALQKIVVVRYSEVGTLPLVTPEQQTFLYQNLHATLENAMWALLHGQPQVYQVSLQQLTEWVKKYFIQDSPVTEAVLKELDALQKMDVRPVMPKNLMAMSAMPNN